MFGCSKTPVYIGTVIEPKEDKIQKVQESKEVKIFAPCDVDTKQVEVIRYRDRYNASTNFPVTHRKQAYCKKGKVR